MKENPKVRYTLIRDGDFFIKRIPLSELRGSISEEAQAIITAVLVRSLRESGHLR